MLPTVDVMQPQITGVTCLLGDTLSGNLYLPPLGLQYSKFGNCVTLLFHQAILILPCW